MVGNTPTGDTGIGLSETFCLRFLRMDGDRWNDMDTYPFSTLVAVAYGLMLGSDVGGDAHGQQHPRHPTHSATGKKTVAVRLGQRASRILFSLCLLAPISVFFALPGNRHPCHHLHLCCLRGFWQSSSRSTWCCSRSEGKGPHHCPQAHRLFNLGVGALHQRALDLKYICLSNCSKLKSWYVFCSSSHGSPHRFMQFQIGQQRRPTECL